MGVPSSGPRPVLCVAGAAEEGGCAGPAGWALAVVSDALQES